MRIDRRRSERLAPEETAGRPRWSPDPRWVLAIFTVAMLVLIALSGPRRVGDGGEYMVQALRISALEHPALTREEAAEVREVMQELGAGYENILPHALHDFWRSGDGRYDMPHFWLYPSLAVPGIWGARLVGIHPQYGFVLLNLVLLLGAFWVALRRLGTAVSILLFGGPVLWWIDKAHTEIFIFGLLTIALLLLPEHPWWSLVALGAVAAQNPAFSLIVVAAVAAVALGDAGRLRDRRLWIGAAAGGTLALLHPLYYSMRLGVPFPQSWGVDSHVPSLAEVGAVIWDTNIGLLTNFPLLAPALGVSLVVLLVRDPRKAALPTVLLGVVGALMILVIVAQTINHNHGGTPSMSRYGIWILPFAMPLLGAAQTELRGRWGPALAVLTAASVSISLFTYSPTRPPAYQEPTSTASYVWSRHPGLENPLAEIFFERVADGPVDQAELRSVAVAGCEKVLVVDGVWPAGCPETPDPLPDACDGAGALCYANRGRPGYDFVPAPR